MVWYKHQELVKNATTLNDNGSANSVDTAKKFFGVERWYYNALLVPLTSV
jgi:hypothetical protein